MFQAFEWYIDDDGKHWRRLARDIPALNEIGFTAMWIPPGCKGQNDNDTGYGIYGNLALKIVLTSRLMGPGRI